MISDLRVKDRTRPSAARSAQRGVRIHRWAPTETRGSRVSFRHIGDHRVRVASFASLPFDRNASIRHRLAAGASEKIQLTAMLGAFKNAVEISARP